MRQKVVYLTLATLLWHFALTNSRTARFWKLDSGRGKIIASIAGTVLDELSFQPFDASADVYMHDEIFDIITSTTKVGSSSSISNSNAWDTSQTGGYGWVRESPDNLLESLMTKTNRGNNSSVIKSKCFTMVNGIEKSRSDTVLTSEETLECKSTNYTFYDYVLGAGNRVIKHKILPEPEVAYIFLKNKDENDFTNFDVTVLERRLKRARRGRPLSAYVYNQIGQYWRILGDTRRSTDCFRCALALAPLSGEISLNIARVMYKLQYYHEAIQFARRSMEVQPSSPWAWKQYFTLGEIFKICGNFQESHLNLRRALALYPNHEPILKALTGMELPSSPRLRVNTLVIIVALVVVVLFVIFTSTSSNKPSGLQKHYEPKMQRHFKRAVAMRSLEDFSSSRNFRRKRNIKNIKISNYVHI